MSSASPIRILKANVEATVEERIPAAFAPCPRPERKSILTGIEQIDAITGGVPLGGLTELCGSNLASSGKTSLVASLLAAASQKYFCALVDACDSFDPASAEAAGVNLGSLLWVRCGKSKTKLRPLEQAFKAADMLLQSSGFGLVVVDVSGISERFVRNIPLTTWFRFSRVIEKQNTALVFVEQQPHATSCAGLVLRLETKSSGGKLWPGNLLTQLSIEGEVLRTRDKKPLQNANPNFNLQAQWA